MNSRENEHASTRSAVIEEPRWVSHTPGPWRVAIDQFNMYIETSEELTVAAVRKTGTPASVANARLIAAAPDMLAALKRLMEQPTMSPLDMTPEQRQELWAAHARARNAIAKAEGR